MSIFTSMDNIAKDFVVLPEGAVFPEYGGIIFILLFFVIFSISFASTAFIPIFKGEDKMNNIRAMISLSIAFLASVFYFDLLTQALLFFGVWMILSFFLGFVILAVTPKASKENAAKKIIPASLIICLLLTIVLFMGYGDSIVGLIDSIAKFLAMK